MEPQTRVDCMQRLVRMAASAVARQRALLLAQIAVQVKLLPAAEHLMHLRAILEASAVLNLPERLAPLLMVFFQARALPGTECAMLHTQCRVLAEDEQIFATLAASVDTSILDLLGDARLEDCPSALLGLILQAIDEPETYENESGVCLLLEAIQRLPLENWAPLLMILRHRFRLIDLHAPRILLRPLLAIVPKICAGDRVCLIERLVWDIGFASLDEQATLWFALLAATRQLNGGDRATSVVALHQRVVSWEDEPSRCSALVQLCRLIGEGPLPQRMPMLAQLAVSTARLPLAEQAMVYHEILDASAAVKMRRVLLALVRQYSRALAPLERQRLRERCQALETTPEQDFLLEKALPL